MTTKTCKKCQQVVINDAQRKIVIGGFPFCLHDFQDTEQQQAALYMDKCIADCVCQSNYEVGDEDSLPCNCFTRGEDYALKQFIVFINNILDGKDNGFGFNHEPLETIRRRLSKLVNNQKSEQQQREIQQAPKLGSLSREQIEAAVKTAHIKKQAQEMPIKFINKEQKIPDLEPLEKIVNAQKRMDEIIYDMLAKYYTEKEEEMPIKFIPETEEERKEFTFVMVKNDQFFVSMQGSLWMKIDCDSAIRICTINGEPEADYSDNWYDDDVIQRILPKIKKIEF